MHLDLEAFLSGLIHAVNNPLTYVQTNLTSLRRDVRDLARLLEACEALLPHVGPEHAALVAEVRRLRAHLALDRPGETLDTLAADCQDGLRQVQALLRATRQFPKRLHGEPAPFDADAWVAAAAERFRAGGGRGLEHVALAPLGQIVGVRPQWDDLLDALLHNAREAVRASGGAIRLTCDAGAVLVDDAGPGVSALHRDRVFLPYYTTRPGATGLGLTLARAVARAAGGDVILQDASGELGGARFIVRLPNP